MPSDLTGTVAIEQLIAVLDPDERLILPALQAVQRSMGYVPEDAISVVAQALNVSRAEVVGVLTYYHDLRSAPSAPVLVRLCGAEACQAVGGRELRAWAEEEYRSDVDVSIETVYCLGNCALGPAAQVNGRLLGLLECERLAQAVSAAGEEDRS